MAAAVREISHRIDPNAFVGNIRTLDQHLANIRSAIRTPALLTLSLAIVAICLVGIGCVALFGSVVRQNRRELAIRMALGADARKLTLTIVTRAVLIVGTGIGLGWIGAVYVAKRIASQLYQTNPLDPVPFVAVALLVMFVSVAASYFPARTAAKTDPATVLRQQ
jgi:ABC-type antimicrobial peptide transport system permease subunit